jgi:hypothetical protein
MLLGGYTGAEIGRARIAGPMADKQSGPPGKKSQPSFLGWLFGVVITLPS